MSSFSLTGRTIVRAGTALYEVEPHSKIATKRFVLKVDTEMRMGVHGPTNETVYHPIINGRVSTLTFFNERYDPRKYERELEDFYNTLDDSTAIR